MAIIHLDASTYRCRDNETLLDALVRQGRNIPFSCRSGVCHTCLMRALKGPVPAQAQAGLSADLVAKGYFLPCKCRPDGDLHISPPSPDDLLCAADLIEKKPLSEDVWQLLLEPHRSFEYRAGQFVRIQAPFGGSRSYSLASLAGHDYYLELHIRRHPQGRFSRWLIDEVEPGTTLHISVAQGDNHYQGGSAHLPLVLAGTGTGLAPLLGVARDALLSGHQGDVHLFHGAAKHSELYALHTLQELARQYPTFHFHPCVVDELTIEQALGQSFPTLSGTHVHLAGNPGAIDKVKTAAAKLGADPARIICDPFTPSVAKQMPTDAEADDTESYNAQADETPYPAPDPELWQAVQEGVLLKAIVNDFYDAVYQDPVLSHYFHNTTKQRVQEKAYSFYLRLFSGAKVYFGDRPRNAHHWMVISDEIFDYRENLLKTFMRKHGLSEPMMAKWLATEERYRKDIVKAKPRGRSIGGSEGPADGFGSIELSVGAMCDACQGEIDSGTQVRYHLRTGAVYCPQCACRTQPEEPGT